MNCHHNPFEKVGSSRQGVHQLSYELVVPPNRDNDTDQNAQCSCPDFYNHGKKRSLGGIASPSGSCRIIPEAESLIRSRDENTPLASSTSFRRASTRALPGRGQPRRFIRLTRMGGCRTTVGFFCGYSDLSFHTRVDRSLQEVALEKQEDDQDWQHYQRGICKQSAPLNRVRSHQIRQR